MRHRWKYVGRTRNANVYVDYSQRKTKIVTEQYEYIHDGIYPFHDYDNRRRYRR